MMSQSEIPEELKPLILNNAIAYRVYSAALAYDWTYTQFLERLALALGESLEASQRARIEEAQNQPFNRVRYGTHYA